MSSIVIWPVTVAVVIATVSDVRSQRIPNWLIAPFLFSGFVVGAVTHGWSGVLQSLLGILMAAAIMGFLYYLGGMGMGDVKLCAAIGCWVGPRQLSEVLLVMALAGAVMAMAWALIGGFFRQTLRGIRELLIGFRKNGVRPHPTLVLQNPVVRRMPYAPAIAIGTILSFLTR